MRRPPAKPLAWALRSLPGGGFTAHRREWLLAPTLVLGCMTVFFAFMALGAGASGDVPAALSVGFGAAGSGFSAWLSSRRQKSFAVRGTLAVVSDRLSPRARRRIHRVDLDEVQGFSVLEQPPSPGESRGTWKLRMHTHGGAEVLLVSGLSSLREAEWLRQLAESSLPRPGPRGPATHVPS
ncbi:MAG: hypothetical protein RL653_4095 [Pseudomonadota bacterium]